MVGVVFILNGEPVRLEAAAATRTALDWLREERGLTGTKEGCNEGDCGACTVMLTDAAGSRAVNACLLFLPQLHGKALRTVEGIAGPGGALHPVQRALVAHHASQCGFCTPGFVVAMAVAHLNGWRDPAEALAGNLCRCTGYAPILRAAAAVADEPVPDWMGADRAALAVLDGGRAEGQGFVRPETADALAAWCLAHPEGTLVAGATDVGLWVNKDLRDLGPVAFVGAVAELRAFKIGAEAVEIGAAVTLAEVRAAMAALHPGFARMLGRFGSAQVRAVATLGGNLANGSPVGDAAPALIALGAEIRLRRGEERRTLPLEAFFLDHRRQDRRPGEFVEAVRIPRQPDGLSCHKVSKRFDQDIASVCGCFNLRLEGGRVAAARIAFGGMAGIPKRARAVEEAIVGRAWTEATVEAALPAFAADFRPIDDHRGSAAWRLAAARNLLWRCLHESRGVPARVEEVGL